MNTAKGAPGRLWEAVKPILLPYDGMASQLYVLDLPYAQLTIVVSEFLAFVPNVTLGTFRSESGGTDLPEPSALTIDDFGGKQNLDHRLDGTHPTLGGFLLYLWPDHRSARFDAEIVFWSNFAFPDPNDDRDCISRFELIANLAEQFRSFSQSSEVVLSSSETGDPRDHRDEEWTIWW